MAQRAEADELAVAAYARTAVEQVQRSTDPSAAAARVLAAAPDARFQRAVLETAAGAGDRATVALIRAALATGDPLQCRTAAEQLIYLGRSPDVFDLLTLSMQSPDGAVRRRAVDALENCSDARAASFLAPALLDKEDLVRRAATAVLGLVVGTHYHELRTPILEALSHPDGDLARAVAFNEDEQVRRMVAQSLAFARSDAVLPTLELLAKDKDDEVRQETVLCLAALGTDKATDLMATMLTDKSYRVASTVVDMLAGQLGTGSSAFLVQLQRALAHPLAEVRRQAVLMLDRFTRKEVEPILLKAAQDEDFEVARRAGEMLRRFHAEEGLGWLSDEIDKQEAGERAMPVWEAGNIGMVANVRAAASGGAPQGTEEVVPMLERAITEGSSSDKLNAVGELTGLCDIGDSQPMRDALYDRDSSVRSRAADALPYTRDAGLLAKVLADHPDAFVRRRAAEALARNPGGPSQAGRLLASVGFAGTRTCGMELFGRFLQALRDADTGVQQQACESIREYAQRAGMLPVPPTVAALERVADDPQVSVLLQEDAANTAEAAGKIVLVGVITSGVDAVLAWRGKIARQAHALRSASGEAPDAVDASIGAEDIEEWVREYALSAEQAQSLRGLLAGQEKTLDPKAAEQLMAGMARDLAVPLDCVAHAARALRLIAHQDAAKSLAQWCAAVEAAPRLDWRSGDAASGHVRRLYRHGRRAWIETRLAMATLAGEPLDAAIADAAADKDDWVKMSALEAGGRLLAGGEPAEVLALCRAHAADRDYAEPVGRCAVALLAAGQQGAVELARQAIGAARTDFSMEMIQRVMIAAQSAPAASLLRADLDGRRLDSAGDLCLALALRGAGNSLAGLDLPDAAELAADLEARCARLALGAMDNEPAPAAELEQMLREGNPQERYAAAWHLSLARVRSAVPVFASVRDQDLPYLLRALVAASLVRFGHGAGHLWFVKTLASTQGEQAARILMHLSAAVEDTIPLMLECRDVNVGRFV